MPGEETAPDVIETFKCSKTPVSPVRASNLNTLAFWLISYTHWLVSLIFR